MKIIGLTGGIGTGKSTVAGFLQELGAVCRDLDKTGHEVLRSVPGVRRQIVEAFGTGILGGDGEIDRAKLGDIVFQDRRALQRLNGIIHPAIDEAVRKELERYRAEGAGVVVLEAAAMLEAGRAGQVDEVWITVAPASVVLERLAGRSGYSEKESLTRIRSQMTDAERRQVADVVIETDGTLAELRERVREAWEALMQRINREQD